MDVIKGESIMVIPMNTILIAKAGELAKMHNKHVNLSAPTVLRKDGDGDRAQVVFMQLTREKVIVNYDHGNLLMS